MTASFYHDEWTLWHAGALHAGNLPVGGWVQPPAANYLAESPEPKRRIVSLMQVSGLWSRFDHPAVAPLDAAALHRVHAADYLARFAAQDATGGSLGPDGTFGPGGFGIAQRSASLACTAVDDVLSGRARRAYALCRPPGHHCLPDRALGFCLLANAAIAVEQAIERHRLSRVVVLDWDVHHGNGTEAIFYERPDVLTVSIHQERCYPVDSGDAAARGRGRGEGCNVNVPLLPGGGDGAYADAFDIVVEPLLRRYRPELIVVACGFDANALDPLARMLAHSETFRMLMQRTRAVADDVCGGRLVAVHEGGYSEQYVPFCAHAALEALAGARTGVTDPILDFVMAQQPSEDARALQAARLHAQAATLGLK